MQLDDMNKALNGDIGHHRVPGLTETCHKARDRHVADMHKWVCRITSHISSRLTNGLVSFRVHTARTGAKEFVCEVVARKVEEENIDDDDLILTMRRKSRPWSLACRSIIPTTPGPRAIAEKA